MMTTNTALSAYPITHDWQERYSSPDAFNSILRCYNLPLDIGDEYYFFRDHGGAPLATYHEVAALLCTYSGLIDNATSEPACEGLGSFIKDALTGRTVRVGLRYQAKTEFTDESDVDEGAGKRSYEWFPGCLEGKVAIEYRNGAPLNPEWTEPAFDQSCGDREDADCNEGVDPIDLNPGVAWSAYLLWWRSYQFAYYTGGVLTQETWWATTVATPHGIKAPIEWNPIGYTPFPGDRYMGARGGAFRVWLQPVILGAVSELVDRLLFAARAALDYAPELLLGGCPGLAMRYLQAAREFGKMALVALNQRARVLGHELAHTYVGPGHCSWNCCWDAALARMQCALSARLGLPLPPRTYEQRFVTPSWDRNYHARENEMKCSGGGVVNNDCWIVDPIVGRSDALYCDEGCSNADPPQGVECVFIPS